MASQLNSPPPNPFRKAICIQLLTQFVANVDSDLLTSPSSTQPARLPWEPQRSFAIDAELSRSGIRIDLHCKAQLPALPNTRAACKRNGRVTLASEFEPTRSPQRRCDSLSVTQRG